MRQPSDDADEAAILREALEALDMPRSGVALWLAHLERFYRSHGGDRTYDECLALVSTLRRLDAAEPPR